MTEDRERFPGSADWESDAPFRLRIPLMGNASRVGECIARAKARRIPGLWNLLICSGMASRERAL